MLRNLTFVKNNHLNIGKLWPFVAFKLKCLKSTVSACNHQFPRYWQILVEISCFCAFHFEIFTFQAFQPNFNFSTSPSKVFWFKRKTKKYGLIHVIVFSISNLKLIQLSETECLVMTVSVWFDRRKLTLSVEYNIILKASIYSVLNGHHSAWLPKY